MGILGLLSTPGGSSASSRFCSSSPCCSRTATSRPADGGRSRALRGAHRVPAVRSCSVTDAVRGVERTTSAWRTRSTSARSIRFEIPDAVISIGLLVALVGSRRLARGPVPPLEGRRAPADQVGGPRADLLVCSFVSAEVLLQLGVGRPASSTRSCPGSRSSRLPVSIGDRRPAVPPVRARRRREEGARRRGVRLLVIGAYARRRRALRRRHVRSNESSGSCSSIALLLGLAFRPVTRFARRIADRIVYGRRATPYEVLAEFSERMGESYATEDVLGSHGARSSGQATGAAIGAGVAPRRRAAATGCVVADRTPSLRRSPEVTDDALPAIAGETPSRFGTEASSSAPSPSPCPRATR